MIKISLLLPDSVCKKIETKFPNLNISSLLIGYKSITIKKFLWRPSVETYITLLIDPALFKEIKIEAEKRKLDINLLIRSLIHDSIF